MKIGVALSSGGSATMSQVGVLEELVGAGIPIACAAGTSGGAIVAASFCAQRMEAYRDATCALTRRQVLRLFDPTWPRLGMLQGRRGMEFLRPFLGGRIEDLPRPFAAVATDLDTGLGVTLAEGEVALAVRASAAVPGILTPVEWKGRLLIDGGLANPIPVSVARALGADFVIAVNALPLAESVRRAFRARPGPTERLMAPVRDLLARNGLGATLASGSQEDSAPEALSSSERRGLVDVILRAGHVAECQIAAMRLREDRPDFLITVPVPHVGLFDFHRSAELVAAGRAVASQELPALRRALARAEPLVLRLRRRFGSSR